jgi:oligopeptide/dipeptide ABC transporter ATP-binding protein
VAALLEVEGLSVRYATAAGEVRAVEDVSFEIFRGETLGLVGESGCGKSSLGRAILQLIPASSGSVRFDGADLGALTAAQLKPLRRRFQPVLQDPLASLDPRMNVGDALGEALAVRSAADRPTRDKQIAALLETIGLPAESGCRRPHAFSAGQRQRLCIARALAVEPDFLVLDEPVSALDVSVQAQIINLLEELRRTRGLTYLFISHDLGVVAHLATRVAVMYAGRIVELGPTAAVLERPAHPYTRALIASLPARSPRDRGHRLSLAGDPPSPLHRPPGCAFHPRCAHAIDSCRATRPPLVGIAEGHLAACPVVQR